MYGAMVRHHLELPECVQNRWEEDRKNGKEKESCSWLLGITQKSGKVSAALMNSLTDSDEQSEENVESPQTQSDLTQVNPVMSNQQTTLEQVAAPHPHSIPNEACQFNGSAYIDPYSNGGYDCNA